MKKFIVLLILAIGSWCWAADVSCSLTPVRTMSAAEDWDALTIAGDVIITEDTTNVISGSQSVRFSLEDDGLLTITDTDTAVTLKNGLGVWIWFDDDTDMQAVAQIQVYVQEDGSNGYWNRLYQDDNENFYPFEAGKWNYVWLPKSYLKVNSLATPTAWTATYSATIIKFRIARDTGVATQFNIGGIVTDNPNMGGFVICFDDAKAGVYTYAYPLIKAKGWRACVGVISDKVGDAGYMTLAQIQELHTAGWDICNHSNTHAVMNGLTMAQVVSEIQTCQNYLWANGLYRGSRVLMWPGNEAIPTTVTDWYGSDIGLGYGAMIRGNSLSYPAVTKMTLQNTGSSWLRGRWEQLPYYAIYSTDSDETWAGTYEAGISAITDNGGVVSMYSHNVIATDAGSGSTDMEIALFTEMINWLYQEEQANRLKVITFTEWYTIANNTTEVYAPTIPAISDVRKDVVYGDANSLTGTYNPAKGWLKR